MKFRDRHHAAEILAERLKPAIEPDLAKDKNAVALGIPRGGVIVGDIVARVLGIDFDIVIGRKLGAPGNKELAIGAIMEDGTAYINNYLVDALHISREYIENEKLQQEEEIRRRTKTYRQAGNYYDLKDRTVILVDDGIATGATVIAAARWIRKQLPHRLIIGVPVAPNTIMETLGQESDIAIVISSPHDFNAVGEFYNDFKPVEDEEVIKIMRSRGLL